jgi:hypothetical protein
MADDGTGATRFGYVIDRWHEARAEIRAILITCARECRTITYGVLCAQVRSAPMRPYSFAFAAMLDEIGAIDLAEGKTPLAALVVRKADGRPGGGYFTKSFLYGATGDDLEAYWQAQFAAVCREWA